MTTSKVEQRKQKIKDKVGDNVRINTVIADWTKIDENGVFAGVNAKGHSVLEGKLDFRDLGIDDIPRNLAMRIGNPPVGYLPEKYRNGIKTSIAGGYRALRHWGFELQSAQSFLGGNGKRWLHWRAFERFEHDFTREHDRLQSVLGEAIGNYDAICEQMRDSFTILAESSKLKLERQGVTVNADFVDKMVGKLMARVPSLDYLKSGITMQYEIGVMMFGSEFYAEKAATLEAQSKARASQYDLQAQDAVLYERARQQRLEGEQVLRFKEAELKREAEAKERMRQMRLRSFESTLASQISPLQEAVMQLHSKLNEIAQKMLVSIRKNGYVHQNTAATARELGEWMQALNVTDDASLEKLVNRLQDQASSAPAERDPTRFEATLDMIVEATHEAAKTATDSGNKWALEW